MTSQPRQGVWAGVAAAAVGLAVGEVAAAFIAPRATPLVAVGGAVIDMVPPSGKELAIRLFGTNDKVALQVGTVVILAGFAAVLGMATLRRWWIGAAGVALFGAVGLLAAVTRAGATVTWAVPSVLAAAAAAAVLWFLLRQRYAADPPTGAPQRRHVLQLGWALIAGSAVVGFAARTLGQNSAVDSARKRIVLPSPSGLRASAPAQADVAGLSYTTANETFYRIDTAIVTPRIDPDDWRLTVRGKVAHPFSLTFDELLRRPMIERYITLACVSNEVGGDLIGNARWLGVPVKDLLDQAGVDPAADQVVSRSVDGFTAGTPTAALLDGRDAMVAVGMNGFPLPVAHGFPARLVVPGLYGYVSATKWLVDLEVTTFADFDAYWIPRGWARQAPIKTSSRIDRPRPGAVVPAGPVMVAGVAWAQHRGISFVEVKVDDGPWRRADLAATVSIDTWRLWSWRWDAPVGSHRLSVRAADNAGELQLAQPAPPAPDGATGLHTISVTVE